MKKKIATWVALATVALAVVGGIVWWVKRPTDPPIKYETSAIDRGRLSAHVTASGTVSALVTVQVGSQVSGRVESLFVDFNSKVKKGEVIAKIDPRLFEADVQKARANLTAANGNFARTKADAELAERQATRARGLNAEGLSSKADLDTAESAAVSAKAQVEAQRGAVEQARAAVQQAELNLAYTVIKSPIDGVVISRSVDVGQTVAASLSAPTLFTIAEDLSKMQVDTFVAEADVGKLQPGTTATFTVDAFPGRRFQGKVREIRNAPQTVQNVVTYDAVIDVDNPNLELKPGMTANVTVIVAEKDDVLRVPNAALRFRPGPEVTGSASAGPPGGRPPRGSWPRSSASPAGSGEMASPEDGADPRTRGDRKTVYVLVNGIPKPMRIRTGITDGNNTELLDGELAEGAEVITSSSGGPTPTAAPTGGRPGGGMRRMF